jgi:hypothetical protein
MSKIEFGRRRIGEIAASLVIVFAVVQLSEAIGDRSRSTVPASDWFVVNEIYVPDHEAGADPRMIYDRTIKEDFVGFWIAEVQRVKPGGLFQHECSGFGVVPYTTDDTIENDEVSWSWFMGRDCDVPPGRYRIRATYTMKRPGWPEKETSATSNLFTVE